MEILLHDRSRLTFTWVKPGLLSIELWKPGHLRDGHGWLLRGSTLLEGEELGQFVAAIAGPPEPEPLLAA